jgi:hypothetical protein
MPELDQWGGFYSIVGSAAGALIGLQFVVLTLIAERPTRDAEQATAAFGSPTVFHFGAALFLAAALRAPVPTIISAAILWGAMGLTGLIYSVVVLRRMHHQRAYHPIFEDWLFHILLPFLAYIALTLSPFAAVSHTRAALFTVGGAVLLLLFVGIHNAWDNVSYLVLVHTPQSKSNQDPDDGK